MFPELTHLPAQFGRYQIMKKLGEGAMGSIFLAHDTQLGRQMALKTLRFDLSNSPALLTRFQREARAAARLCHPNICSVYEAGEIDGIHYLTMPYIEGNPLSDLVRRDGPLPPEKAALLVRKLAQAMAYAHEHGIIHRDLKPSNIILDLQDEPVIMDFGLALLTRQTDQAEARTTQAGSPVGTAAYMAPEQVRADLQAMGPRSDIYSLGVILYQLLTGQLPFQGSPMAVLGQVLTEEPPPPHAFRPDVDRELEAICLRAMSKKPEDRYATMAEMAQALENYPRHEVSAAPRTAPVVEAPDAPVALPQPAAPNIGPRPEWRSAAERRTSTDGDRARWPTRGLNLSVSAGCSVTALLFLSLAVVFLSGWKVYSGSFPTHYVTLAAGALLALGLLAWWLRLLFLRTRRRRHYRTLSGGPLLALDLLGGLLHVWWTRIRRPRTSPPPAAEPATPVTWKPPAVVGGYRLGDLLGRGGSAEVYRGEHVVLGSPAAIKIFRTAADLPPNRLQRALREAALVARLKHPHIVPVFNAGQETDYFFVAMEYVAGGDVARLVEGKPGLPLARALAIAGEVAAALHYVHRHGLVHRDVKPSNILLDGDGRALLSDFGSVKSLQDQTGRLTADGEIVGTPAYMAPEQALGQPVTAATDLYGFGCLLFYLVTGQDVFQGNSMALLGQQIHGPPPSPRGVNPAVPQELDRLILELLRKKPAERPADMAEVLRRLEAIPLAGGSPSSQAVRAPEPEAFQTLAGLPLNRDPRADESIFGLGVFAAAWGSVSSVQTIVPLGPAPSPAGTPSIRLQRAGPDETEDKATKAGQQWQQLRESDAAEAERFWLQLPENVRAAPPLAAAREAYAQQQADRLFAQALDGRRRSQPADAIRWLHEALTLVPQHREASLLLQELEAVPLMQVDQLKVLARAGKPQRVPALAAMLCECIQAAELADYLRAQPECAVYRDPCNLEEFLFERHGKTRERILGDLFNLRELRQLLQRLGEEAAPGLNKEELIQRILEALGFQRLVLPEGIDSFLREVTVECRGLEVERDRLKLLGIGTKIFCATEGVVKDLVHFYGYWLHGPGYLDELRRRGWVPVHAKSVQKLALGSLNQSFLSLAEEALGRAECRKVFPAGKPLLPESLVRRLHRLEPHRNQVFCHHSSGTHNLPIPELRTITLEVRDTICDFFHHIRAAEVFPRKLILDRTVQDRHGQTSYFCLSDRNEEVEVIPDCRFEAGQVYLCLSASNPKYLHPVVVPELVDS